MWIRKTLLYGRKRLDQATTPERSTWICVRDVCLTICHICVRGGFAESSTSSCTNRYTTLQYSSCIPLGRDLKDLINFPYPENTACSRWDHLGKSVAQVFQDLLESKPWLVLVQLHRTARERLVLDDFKIVRSGFSCEVLCSCLQDWKTGHAII